MNKIRGKPVQVKVEIEYDDGTKGWCFVMFDPAKVHPKSFIEGMLQGRKYRSYIATLAPSYTEVLVSGARQESAHV